VPDTIWLMNARRVGLPRSNLQELAACGLTSAAKEKGWMVQHFTCCDHTSAPVTPESKPRAKSSGGVSSRLGGGQVMPPGPALYTRTSGCPRDSRTFAHADATSACLPA
jgi:hypothetical protein